MPAVLFAKFGQYKALVAMVVVAGVGWGAAAAALTAVRLPVPAPATASPVADLSGELRDRTNELSALQAKYRDAQRELQQRRMTTTTTAPALPAVTAPPPASDPAALAAATATVTRLQAQLGDLKSQNAGLEQNYADLLDALHRAQAEILTDRQRIAADESKK